jgi:hypothetical protein
MGIHTLEFDVDSFGQAYEAEGLGDLKADLYHGYHARAVLSQANLAAAARLRESATVSRLGMHVTDVYDGLDFHDWGQRETYDCWDDDAFLREHRRDVPGVEVKSKTGRTMITSLGRPWRNNLPVSAGGIVLAGKYTQI